MKKSETVVPSDRPRSNDHKLKDIAIPCEHKKELFHRRSLCGQVNVLDV